MYDTDDISHRRIPAQIRKLEELPPLPANERRLLALVNDDDIDLRDLAEVIETCPPVAARVLGVARSAFFSRNNKTCDSVFDAVVQTIGLDLLRCLVIGIVTSGSFRPERCPGFDAQRYWHSALSAAAYARLLARECRSGDAPHPNQAYLYGLLHNLGLLALAHVVPQDMSQVLLAARNTPDRSLVEIETELLGCNHADAGGWLMSRWQLPADLVTVVAKQFDDSYRGPCWVACELLRISVHEARRAAGPTDDHDSDDEGMVDEFVQLGLSDQCREPVARRFSNQMERISGMASAFAH